MRQFSILDTVLGNLFKAFSTSIIFFASRICSHVYDFYFAPETTGVVELLYTATGNPLSLYIVIADTVFPSAANVKFAIPVSDLVLSVYGPLIVLDVVDSDPLNTFTLYCCWY